MVVRAFGIERNRVRLALDDKRLQAKAKESVSSELNANRNPSGVLKGRGLAGLGLSVHRSRLGRGSQELNNPLIPQPPAPSPTCRTHAGRHSPGSTPGRSAVPPCGWCPVREAFGGGLRSGEGGSPDGRPALSARPSGRARTRDGACPATDSCPWCRLESALGWLDRTGLAWGWVGLAGSGLGPAWFRLMREGRGNSHKPQPARHARTPTPPARAKAQSPKLQSKLTSNPTNPIPWLLP